MADTPQVPLWFIASLPAWWPNSPPDATPPTYSGPLTPWQGTNAAETLHLPYFIDSFDVSGLGGDDYLGQDATFSNGFGSRSIFRGGLGNDFYALQTRGDQVIEDPGAGVDTVWINETRDEGRGSDLTIDPYVLAANVENGVLDGDVYALHGNALDNVLVVSGSKDLFLDYGGVDLGQALGGGYGAQLFGWGGDDTIGGSGTNDLIDGGDGFDTYRTVGARADYLLTSYSDYITINDKVTGREQTDTLRNIELIVFSDQKTAIGTDRDDTLLGRVGVNEYWGGGGTDTVSFANYQGLGNLGVTARLDGLGSSRSDPGNAFYFTDVENLTGTSSGDELYGDDQNNILIGGGGNDFLSPGAGDDLLDGGAGDDSLYARAGEDFLDGGTGNDRLDGGEGNDHLIGGEGQDRLFGDKGDDLLDGGLGPDLLSGDAGNDVLMGGAEGDVLRGVDGDDTIYGGAGWDLIEGGIGNDRLIGDEGLDKLYGDRGDDTLEGGADDDALYGGAGNDLLLGGASGDVVDGGDGDDLLGGGDGWDMLRGGGGADGIDAGAGYDTAFGGVGNDRIVGEGGDDQLYGEEGADVLLGGLQHDTLEGGDGDDLLGGNEGNDTLNGGAGSDALDGGSGNDILRGGADNDLLDGDAGDNQLWGEGGSDVFRFGDTGGVTTIRDFQVGVDWLQETSTLSVEQIIAGAEVTGGSTILFLDDHTEIALIGVTGVSADWFLPG